MARSRYLALVFFAYLTPLPILGLEFLADIAPGLLPGMRAGGVSVFFFAVATTLELLLSLFLRSRRDRLKLGRARYFFLEYIFRVVIGLPLTVYFTIAAPFGYAAYLRLFPALLILAEGRSASHIVWTLVFYVSGVPAFAALQARGFPGVENIVLCLLAGALGALMLLPYESLARLRRERVDARREAGRFLRRLRFRRDREKALLSVLLPDLQAGLYREAREIPPEGGHYLLAAVAFEGTHEALRYFQTTDSRSERDGLVDFQREWERYLEYGRRLLSTADLRPGAPGEFWHGGRLLGRTERDVPQPERLRGYILHALFQLRELHAFTERTARTLEGRGRKGWRIRTALGIGNGAGMVAGGGNIAWVYRGPIVERLESFLRSSDLRSARSGVWLEPELLEPIRDYFREEDLARNGDFSAPGNLRAEFSRGGRGVEPADDFFERIRFASTDV